MTTVRYPVPPVVDALRGQSGTADVSASAACGKSHACEHLVLDRTLQGESVASVLVLNFAVRATADLRVRIRRRLEDALACAEHRCGARAPHRRIDDGARIRLRRALSELASSHAIHTFHGFARRLIAEGALLLGEPLTQEHADAHGAFAEAFDAVLTRELATELGDELRWWLEHGSYPRRDRTSARGQVDALHDMLFAAHHSQAVVFPPYDPAGAEDALQRVRRQTAPKTRRALDRALRRAGHGWLRKVPDYLDQLTEALEEVEASGARLSSSSPRLQEATRRLLGLKTLAKQRAFAPLLQDLRDLRACSLDLNAAATQLFLPRIRAELRRRRQRGAFTYDDLVDTVREGLRRPSVGPLREALASRYPLVVCDESQDLSEAQRDVLDHLRPTPGSGRLLVTVGDVKQTLYSWRNASPSRALAARDDADHRLTLDENHRSSRDLCRALDLIFSPGVGEPYFHGPIQHDVPIRCGPEARRQSLVDARDRSVPPVSLLRFPPGTQTSPAELVAAQGRFVAAEIARIRSGALCFGPKGAEEAIPLAEIFVLARTGWEARRVARLLDEEGVPCHVRGDDGLFQTEAAEQVQRLLEAIVEPSRSHRVRAWSGPFFGLSLAALAEGEPGPEHHPALRLLERWRDLGERRRWPELFASLLHDSGLVRRERFFGRDPKTLTNVEHVLELLNERALATGCDLRHLLRWLRGLRGGQRSVDEEGADAQRLPLDAEDAVQVLTVHACKGLAAHVVFVVGGLSRPRQSAHTFRRGKKEEGAFLFDRDGRRHVYLGSLQRLRQIDREAHDLVQRGRAAEERRVGYVACTRPRGRLYLSVFPSAPGAEAKHPKEGSSYVHLDGRLRSLLEHATPAQRRLFETRDAEPYLDPPRPKCSEDGTPPPWTPPPDLLDESTPARPETAERLRRRARGLWVTSYTGLRDRDRPRSEVSADTEALELVDEPADDLPVLHHPVPGGVGPGLCFHELLERLELRTCAEAQTLAGWSRHEPTRRLFVDTLSRYGLDPAELLEPAQRMVWGALKTPLRAPGLVLPGGLASADLNREVEFVCALDDGVVLRGYLDALLRVGDTVWWVDWKTDFLPDGYDDLARVCAERYRRQIQAYSLAVARLTGAAPPGSGARSDRRRERPAQQRIGYVYAYLRGADPSRTNAGFYVDTLDADAVRAGEAELRRLIGRTA